MSKVRDVRGLICVKNQNERAQVKAHFINKDVNMHIAVSTQDALESIRQKKGFHIVILDDAFDASSENANPDDPTISDLLQELQDESVVEAVAVSLVLLRPNDDSSDKGFQSEVVTPSAEDRRTHFAEQGAFDFIEKPYILAELNKSLAALFEASRTPPKWFVALTQLKAMVGAGQHEQALELHKKFYEVGVPMDFVGFSLLKITALSAIGKHEEALEEIRAIELQYPTCLSVKLKSVSLLLSMKRYDEAFEEQIGIIRTEKSVVNFEKSLKLIEEVHAEIKTENDIKADDFAMSSAERIIEVFGETEEIYSKNKRPLLFGTVARLIESPAHWLQLVHLMTEFDDTRPQILEIYRKGLKEFQSLTSKPAVQRISNNCYLRILKADPLDSHATEVVTTYLLAEGRLEELDEILHLCEKAGAKHLEFFVSTARMHLRNGHLREASDVLHKAVQIQADDERVLALRDEWKDAYDTKNNAQAA